MISFKQFLIEGGNALAKFDVRRASQSDVKSAIEFVAKTTGIPASELKTNLLGTTKLTHAGKKKDSGDIDIAVVAGKYSPEEINKKMMTALDGEGVFNAGTKVGSYAVPVDNKKVQVDLMFVSDAIWANWIYLSHQGDKSKYPGAVRNIILFTALAHTQEDGKDFVIRDNDGKSIVRASKSITMDSGMKRLFKMAKFNDKTGSYAKTVSSVEPSEIEDHLKKIGKSIKFSKDKDHTKDPDEVARFIFGKGVMASDLETAEDVIKQIKKLPNSAEILKASKSELSKLGMEIPEELK